MRFSGWLGSVRTLFGNRLRSSFHRRRNEPRSKQSTFHQVETLEQRRVLTLDFVSAYVEDASPFYVTNVTTGAELSESPQQLTLQFTPGVEIDPSPSSLNGISVYRSGGAGDQFSPIGSLTDEEIKPGSIVVEDFPNKNQVIIRFADKLVDDTYRIVISTNTTTVTNPVTGLEEQVVEQLRTVDGETFRDGESFSFDFRLSLGQQITSVVPQPIVRTSDVADGLTQSRNVIELYFDGNEALDVDSVQTVSHYKLIALDEATGADDSVVGASSPDSVVHDSQLHKATLTFLPGDIADGVLYRLEVGGSGVVAAAGLSVEQGTTHDSFAGAQNLGAVDQSGLLISGSINPRAEIESPGTLPTLYYPTQEGTVDEPGHRDVPIDDTSHGLSELSTTAPVVPGGFSIDLLIDNDFSEQVASTFRAAADRWEQVIVGDLSNQLHPDTGVEIDDMYIEIQAGLLGGGEDGPGGVLGNADTFALRPGSDSNPHLPYLGRIGLDPDDVNRGDLFEIMVHEIGHTLGFTDSSYALGLIQVDGNTREWIGPNAIREYRTLNPSAVSVPIETDFGPGSQFVHWDEDEFANEILTPQLNGIGCLLYTSPSPRDS